jgi:hypothetical protein
MKAAFNTDGVPVAFYSEDLDYGAALPNGLTDISDEEWREFIQNPDRRRWDFVAGGVVAIPAPAPAPVVVMLDKLTLFQRMTDAEYDAMSAGVAAQSRRVQDVFNRADTFRDDAPLWPLLKEMAVQLYGAARAAELMTP